jgi:hypothetical protein
LFFVVLLFEELWALCFVLSQNSYLVISVILLYHICAILSKSFAQQAQAAEISKDSEWSGSVAGRIEMRRFNLLSQEVKSHFELNDKTPPTHLILNSVVSTNMKFSSIQLDLFVASRTSLRASIATNTRREAIRDKNTQNVHTTTRGAGSSGMNSRREVIRDNNTQHVHIRTSGEAGSGVVDVSIVQSKIEEEKAALLVARDRMKQMKQKTPSKRLGKAPTTEVNQPRSSVSSKLEEEVVMNIEDAIHDESIQQLIKSKQQLNVASKKKETERHSISDKLSSAPTIPRMDPHKASEELERSPKKQLAKAQRKLPVRSRCLRSLPPKVLKVRFCLKHRNVHA